MKINIIKILNIASALMLIDITNSWHDLMMFIFIGVIPGTNIALSPEQMILIFSSAFCLVILYTLKNSIVNLKKHLNIKHLSFVNRKLKRA